MNSLTFFGDVFLPEPYTSTLDITEYVCNLEYPITESGEGWPDKINLKAETNYLAETFGHDPTAVCLANNHIMDYSSTGLQDTLEKLDTGGIDYFGAGSLSENCHNPLVLDRGDRSVGLLGYVCDSTSPVYATDNRPGVAPIDPTWIQDDIATAREMGADDIIIYLHWGAEELGLPKPADIKTARHLIDGGADLVLGQHAHRIQPYEKYNNGVIFYGLGNCIMPELAVPSYYQDGCPTEQFEKIQRSWNRRSLAVTYDGDTVSTTETIFEDGTLSPSMRRDNKHRFQMGVVYDKYKPLYRSLFKSSYVYTKLKIMALKFVESPQMITLEHLRTVVDLFRADEYD